jgi:hypothetical protein
LYQEKHGKKKPLAEHESHFTREILNSREDMEAMNINKKVKEKTQDTEIKLLKEIVDDDLLGLDNDLLGLDDDDIFAQKLYGDII